MMFEEEMNEFTRNFIFSTEKQLDLASCFLVYQNRVCFIDRATEIVMNH